MKKNKNGYYRASFVDIRGKRHDVRAVDKDELKRKLEQAKIKFNAENAAYMENEKLTLDDYFKTLMEKQLQTGEIKGSTLYKKQITYNSHISPELGAVKVQSLTRRMIENFQLQLIERTKDDYADKKGKLSAATCRSIMSILKSTLNNAVRDEVIAVNPMNGVKTIKNTSEKATETYHRALSKEEQAIFFEAAKNNYYYEFLAFMVSTGMRIGEVATLSVADVDYKKNCIHIAKTTTVNADGNVITGDSAKTDASKRDIPMNENIKGLINAQLEKRQAIFNSKAVIPIDTPIFTTSRGGRVFDYLVNKAISKVLAELEADGKHIEPFTSHAFRDTFATRFVEQTKDLHTLQKILGHASFAMTADLYAHVLDETKQDAMQKIQIII